MTTTPTTTTTTPPSTPILYGPLNVEYLNESWCELQYKSGCSSTGSISHLNHSVNPEILEKLLQEAQKDASSQRQSPTLLPAPQPVRVVGGDAVVVVNPIQHESVVIVPTAIAASVVVKPSKKISAAATLSKSATVEAISSSSIAVVPIKSSMSSSQDRTKTSPFCELDDYDDDEVDLEYVEDDEDDDDDDTNVVDENGDMSSYDTIRSKIPARCLPKSSCQGTRSCEPASASTPCPNCLKQKKQIDLLIDRQVKNEKELIRMRNEYEVRLLNKSLELSTHPSTSSSSSSSSTTRPVVVSSSDFNICGVSSANMSSSRSVASSSGANTPATAPLTQTAEPNGRDWIKYFASRPQTQPPKEWNFVHPNSSKSKYANFESPSKPSSAMIETAMTSKLLSRESIGKLIFTHMASFIVGATLMFLVLKRHLNFKNSVYFI